MILKKTFKHLLFILIFALLPITAAAYDFMVDGIAYTYNSNGTSVTVTSTVSQPWNGGNYSELTTANIPSSVTYDGNTYSVTSIGDAAFRGCSGLTSINIPNSVTSIGYGAFADCSGLTSITIPNSVTSIGGYAFKSCSGLTSVTIPNSVTSIGEYAFGGCSGLTSVTIGNSVTSIGDWAFYGCSGLTSITIPNSVTSIGQIAFYGCSGLTSVTIGNSVTSIGGSAFDACSGLTSLTIPNSVTSIGQGAFSGCHSLESIVVDNGNGTYDSRDNCNAIIETTSNTLIAGCKNTTIPNSVTSISSYAFNGCSGLTSVTIPHSVTSIGNEAFRGCSGLTSINIPNSVTSIGQIAFYGCSGLTSVTIGNSVTSIGGSAFDACSSLTSITLTGQGAWSLKSNMPNINQIKTVNIGTGITSLGNFRFAPEVVNCYAEVPPTCSSNTFSNYDGELHVPTTATVAYMTAEYWQNFTNLNNDIVEKVNLNPTTATIALNDELQLSVTTSPVGSTVIWSSSNPNIAVVDANGKVVAKDLGECNIIATLESNPAAYACCQITVGYPEITSLTLNVTNVVLSNVGDSFTLTATTIPANSGAASTWMSSDETVATVDANGVVTATGQGECDITVTVLNQSATCHVTVSSTIVITLDMVTATIAPNEILTLTPSFNPVETDIVATSSDASVAFARAIIQNGVKKVQVVGLAEGTATITVSSVDGKAIPATCVVTVSNAPDVIMGDANGDGTVNVSDYVYVANYILEQNPEPFVFAAADIDGNGEINVSDLVLVANIALTYEDPNTLNAPAPKATMNADIDMNATLHKNADGTTSVTVDLNNSMDLTALQMDISLPQGMAVTGATLTDRATRSHQTEVAQLANGSYRLLAASSASKAFKGNEGALLTLMLSGEPQGTVTLGGIKLASPDGQCFTVNDILLSPVATGVDDIATQAHIYGEAGSIVIESPVNGTAQLVLPNGMSRTVKVKAGRNIYPAPATGLVIVRAGEKAVKLIF